VYQPHRPERADSTRKAIEVLISPPEENPWTVRRMTRHTGAATPMAGHGGSSPMAAVAAAISKIIVARAPRRPNLSARTPIRSEPSGRARNDVLNTAKMTVSAPLSARGTARQTPEPTQGRRRRRSHTIRSRWRGMS
jgi:hypothetical protein